MPLHPDPSVLDTTVRGTLTYAALIACFVAFAVAGVLAIRAAGREPGIASGSA